MDVSSSEMGARLSYSEDISIPAEFQFERHLVAKNIFNLDNILTKFENCEYVQVMYVYSLIAFCTLSRQLSQRLMMCSWMADLSDW